MSFENEVYQDNNILFSQSYTLSSEIETTSYGLDLVDSVDLTNQLTERKLDFIHEESLELEQIDLLQFERSDSSQLVFIDSKVEDSQIIIDSISGAPEVIVLNDEGDELLQISQHLSEYQQLDAVHIISHGASGQLVFENSTLSQDTLPQYGKLL